LDSRRPSLLQTIHITRGDTSVSIQEQAAQLRSIGLPFGAIQQAMQELDNALSQAQAILGDSGTGISEVGGAVGEAKSQLDNAYSAIQQVESVLGEVAARHAQG
jgi:methyl-accepting chemotaxis protein